MQETLIRFLDRKIPRRRAWQPTRLSTPVLLGFPGGSVGKESTCNAGDLGLNPGLGRSPGGGHGNPKASLVVQTVKNLQCGRLGFNSGSERSPGEGNGNPLQYSCLENSMDRGAWWATVHGIALSWI